MKIEEIEEEEKELEDMLVVVDVLEKFYQYQIDSIDVTLVQDEDHT